MSLTIMRHEVFVTTIKLVIMVLTNASLSTDFLFPWDSNRKVGHEILKVK